MGFCTILLHHSPGQGRKETAKTAMMEVRDGTILLHHLLTWRRETPLSSYDARSEFCTILLHLLAGQGRREMPGQEKMEEDGTELLTWHHSWTRSKETAKTGEDSGPWYSSIWHPSLGQGSLPPPLSRRRWRRMVQNQTWHHLLDKGGGRLPRQEKMEEDGTELQTWHHSWTREEGDGQDRRRWRRMVQNSCLASSLDPCPGRRQVRRRWRILLHLLLTWHHSWTREEG